MMLYVIKSAREIWQGGCIQTNLLSLDMVLKTLVFKLWGSLKTCKRGKGPITSIYLNQSQYQQRHRLQYSAVKALLHYLCTGVSAADFVVLWLLIHARISIAGTARSRQPHLCGFKGKAVKTRSCFGELSPIIAGVVLLAAGSFQAEEVC